MYFHHHYLLFYLCLFYAESGLRFCLPVGYGRHRTSLRQLEHPASPSAQDFQRVWGGWGNHDVMDCATVSRGMCVPLRPRSYFAANTERVKVEEKKGKMENQRKS